MFMVHVMSPISLLRIATPTYIKHMEIERITMMINGLQCIQEIPTDKRLAALIDLDGTMFHGSQMIEGADELIRSLRAWGVPYLFVTNNSTRTPDQVAELLCSLGISASAEDVLTTSQAAAAYIAEEYPDAFIYMIGEQGLEHALSELNLNWTSNADCIFNKEQEAEVKVVVQGLDREFSYKKLEAASTAIRAGATFVATNPDLMLPSDKGISPGSGTLTAAIEAASGAKPIFIGKPHAIIMKVALQRLGCKAEDAIVIGDNMMTDIMAGAHAGCHTALVLTGVTTNENYALYKEKSGITPDLILNHLEAMKQWFAVRQE